MYLFEAGKIAAGIRRPTIKAAGCTLFSSLTFATSIDIRRISDISRAANITLTYLRGRHSSVELMACIAHVVLSIVTGTSYPLRQAVRLLPSRENAGCENVKPIFHRRFHAVFLPSGRKPA
jgi:hypothetical protein